MGTEETGGGGGAVDGTRQRALDAVVAAARRCTLCPKMHGTPKTLGPLSGDARARCLVVGEAPGFHGAIRTGRPLSGDRAGEHFEQLLASAGLSRDEMFITNAVLCSPRTPSGRGRKPSKKELGTCTLHVRALLDCLEPRLVVTLGTTALSSLALVETHEISLKHHAGQPQRWNRRWLLPLYHPGTRAMIHRPWASQLRDYAQWRALLAR